VIALEGSRAYGTTVSPAEYDPACNAYRTLASGAQYFRATSTAPATTGSAAEFIELEMAPASSGSGSPYPLALFRNVTNQPTFANGSTCDNMIRLFNTTMSAQATAVRGRVRAQALPFGAERTWQDVWGVQVATPFIENNYLDCRTMQGYTGTGGPGDSQVPAAASGTVVLDGPGDL
jgi:hypothetical protein